MTALLIPLILLTQAVAPSLDQIRSEPNLEHRARNSVEYAAAAERAAETAYSNSDLPAVAEALKNMVAGMEVAKQALDLTGRSASRHPGPYKAVELKSQEILSRLGDLEKRMDADERDMIARPRSRVQEIHDAWFDGIMGKKR